MLKCSVGGHALFGVNGQALFDEVTSHMRDIPPIFDRCERVVGLQDGLHLFQVGIPIEGGVAAKEEVSDDADGPDIATTVLACEHSKQEGAFTQACRGQSS